MVFQSVEAIDTLAINIDLIMQLVAYSKAFALTTLQFEVLICLFESKLESMLLMLLVELLSYQLVKLLL